MLHIFSKINRRTVIIIVQVPDSVYLFCDIHSSGKLHEHMPDDLELCSTCVMTTTNLGSFHRLLVPLVVAPVNENQ